MTNIKNISKIEKGNISDGALTLIAKASEGSVRDSLSLLDRALVSQNIEDKAIDEKFIRKMLGITDRSKILNLLDFIFKGDQKKSIELLREMINEGIEASNFLNDLLEMLYFIQQRKSIGGFDSDLALSEAEQEIISKISHNIKTPVLLIFWQLTLKVLDELLLVSSPILSLEMLIIRFVHLKDMPSYENILQNLKHDISDQAEDNNILESNIELDEKNFTNKTEKNVKISKEQIKNIVQTKPSLLSKNQEVLSFEDLIKISSIKKEIHLKYDLENNVNLIKFSKGKIDIGFNEKLDKNFVRNISEKLLEWTGNRWVITLTKNDGQKTYSEQREIKKIELLNQEKKGDVYNKFKKIFSDIELIEVKKKD